MTSRTYTWKPQNSEGTRWSLYCGVVLLGTIHKALSFDGWHASNFRFSAGMKTGIFLDATSAAKWLLGYDARSLKGKITNVY